MWIKDLLTLFQGAHINSTYRDPPVLMFAAEFHSVLSKRRFSENEPSFENQQ